MNSMAKTSADSQMRSVLITGCSSGIGLLTARLFAARGWQVAATSRRPETLAEFGSAANVLVHALDVTDQGSIDAAVAATLDHFGKIDVLVNNAGYGLFGPLEGSTHGELEAQFATNLFGAAAMMRAVLPGMRERRSGTIVNVSSVAGHVDFPFASAYVATKFALNGLSAAVRHELALFNIRTKLVEPGAFKTSFVEGSMRHLSHPAYEDRLQAFLRFVAKADAKAPTPEPVAETIFRAANDRSHRLHYPVRGAGAIFAKRWLPDVVWRGIMRTVLTKDHR